MRALLLPAVGAPLELVERDVPEPGPGEVRVRVQACGVCGSDLFLQKGGFGADKLPVVPGHEAAGVVDAVGEGVGSRSRPATRSRSTTSTTRRTRRGPTSGRPSRAWASTSTGRSPSTWCARRRR